MTPTKQQKTEILKKIETTVAVKFYDPSFNAETWHKKVEAHRYAILSTPSAETFESAITTMLREFSPGALGLLSKRTAVTSRNAINASFSVQPVGDGFRWVFQDVLPGGVAADAGCKSGDILIATAGRQLQPTSATAAEPPFQMAHQIPITVRRGSPPEEITLSLVTKKPKYKDNPYSDIAGVAASDLGNSVGYLRVSLFPGKIGIDFANQVDRIFQTRFATNDKLIIDLRGNPGGGIGGLTLMSYLTPDRMPIGYSKNRKMAQQGVAPATLPIFDKVPRSKLAIPGLALRFLGKTSVFLYTEALGPKAFRGQVVILVNEHTAGAAEMLAQFAQENKLATIVGTHTPGRLVSRSAIKLGAGYRLIVPVAAYVSAKGTVIEGNGIVPDVGVEWSFGDAVAGRDNQLETAVRTVIHG